MDFYLLNTLNEVSRNFSYHCGDYLLSFHNYNVLLISFNIQVFPHLILIMNTGMAHSAYPNITTYHKMV